MSSQVEMELVTCSDTCSVAALWSNKGASP